jgi:hypothetical protein
LDLLISHLLLPCLSFPILRNLRRLYRMFNWRDSAVGVAVEADATTVAGAGIMVAEAMSRTADMDSAEAGCVMADMVMLRVVSMDADTPAAMRVGRWPAAIGSEGDIMVASGTGQDGAGGGAGGGLTASVRAGGRRQSDLFGSAGRQHPYRTANDDGGSPPPSPPKVL